MSRPHISVKVFPPQAGGNCGKGRQASSGLSPKILNITQLRSDCRAGYAPSAHFRESVTAAGGAEIGEKVTSVLHGCHQSW
jgi:hypothetical protein